MTKIAIDADSFAYKLAPRCVVDGFYTDFEKSEEDDSMKDLGDRTKDSDILTMVVQEQTVACSLSLAKDLVADEIDTICKQLETDEYVCYLTANSRNEKVFKQFIEDREPRKNFRYDVAKDLQHSYKHNRTSEPPAGYDAIIQVIVEHFNGVMIEGAEADDIVVGLCNQLGWKVAAIDKDVLNQAVGTHYNYNKEELVDTTKEFATYYKYYQAIVGDPGDGYKGVPRIGPKGVGNWIKESMTEKEMCEGVIQAFESKGLSVTEAIATIRLADMTQCRFLGGAEHWHIEQFNPANLGIIL